ncbi:probable transmembrane ascorbate ferrireductase 3 [Camellia sinensis]|uniref:probable transmembrane ascorbate ferrireductase 3 n=1 Tax=Camellia sinensis TaxID=4442 RepID=UPI001035A313|nr:probable transmembrane ascorbate ferrireductase 3 [Camellia sinensis]
MDGYNQSRYLTPASRITVVAHLFGITALILLLVWLLHYRTGFDLDSSHPERVFNLHPFLMFFGFIFFAGEAAMAYKTIRASREVQKFCHMLFHLIAIVLGIVGIYTAFKFHNMQHISHMHSLHSWIGMITFCFFGLQWLFGFALFMFPKARPFTREMAMPWHISGGRVLLYMAICTAETGLMQIEPLTSKFSLINFIGLFILFFGITVDLSIALAHYV